MMSHEGGGSGEEEGEWVPLTVEGRGNANGPHHSHNHPSRAEIPASSASRSSWASSASDRSTRSSARASSCRDNWKSASASNSSSKKWSLERIRSRHETKSHVKQTFVHRPLSIFPRRFLYHLIREIWACHPFVRWGILFILSGWMMQMTSISIFAYKSLRHLPYILFHALILSVAIYYLYLQHVDWSKLWNKIENIQVPNSVQDAIVSCLEYTNKDDFGIYIQRMIICVLYVVPAMMEMMALLLLARMNDMGSGDDGSGGVSDWYIYMVIMLLCIMVELYLLLPFHFDIIFATRDEHQMHGSPHQHHHHDTTFSHPWISTMERGKYTFFHGTLVLVKKSNTTLMDGRIHAWICLYAMTLFMACLTVQQHDMHTLFLLGGPFLLATGLFILLSTPRNGDAEEGEDDNLIMNVLRRVIRQTLADVMVEVGEDVAQDEMLRLAMLRWIVDYWAAAAKGGGDSGGGGEGTTFSRRASSSDTGGNFDRSSRRTSSSGNTHVGEEKQPSREEEQPNAASVSPTSNETSLGWSELSSMLSLTMEQMHSETSHNDGAATADDNHNHPFSAFNNNEHQHTSSSTGSSTSNHFGYHHDHQNESVHQLQNMITSFHVDERAKPAVDSYKMTVESIPPSPNVAITIALARRCPALLSCVYVGLVAPNELMQCAVLLFPLMVLEYVRVIEWIAACHETTALLCIRGGGTVEKEQNEGSDEIVSDKEVEADNDFYANLLPTDMNSMQILLSEDSYSTYHRGTALRVWNNIEGSVDALYSGLTAMKCAHTAQVATEVAFNVISLAKFASEARSEGGLGRVGLGLILMDIIEASSSGDDCRGGDGESGPRRYRSNVSSAAVNIIEGGKVLSRNVSELVEEGRDGKNFLSPIISFFFGKHDEHDDADNQQDVKNDDDTNNIDGDNNDCSSQGDQVVHQNGGRGEGDVVSYGSNVSKEHDLDNIDDNKGIDVYEEGNNRNSPGTAAAQMHPTDAGLYDDLDDHGYVSSVPLHDLELHDDDNNDDNKMPCSPLPRTDGNAYEAEMKLDTHDVDDDDDDDDDESWTSINIVPSQDGGNIAHATPHNFSSDTIITTRGPSSASEDLHTTLNAAISLTLTSSEGNRKDDTEDRICSQDGVNRNSKSVLKNETMEGKPSEALKWLGAGAAILGTVIGGIALTGNKEETTSSERAKRGEDTRRRSNVVIERLEEG